MESEKKVSFSITIIVLDDFILWNSVDDFAFAILSIFSITQW